MVEDLHNTTYLYFLDLSEVDMVEDLHVALNMDLGLYVSNLVMELHDVDDMVFKLEDVTIIGCDQL